MILLEFMATFLLLAMLRVPLPFSLGLGAMVTMATAGINFKILPAAGFGGIDAFAFLAIPAFIYAGDIMAQGGVSAALLRFVGAILKRVRGSLGAVVVVSSMLFGSITGSSLATISAIGGMMIPEMLKKGYSKEYGAALVAACGFLGILIPPSVPGVIYAVTAGVSVADVWLATVGPGIFLGACYIVVNHFVIGKREAPITEPFDFRSYVTSVGKTVPRFMVALLMPLIIFAGVYGGVFTPTEAGAVSVAVGAIIGWIIFPLFFKAKPDEKIWSITKKSAIFVAAIMMIVVFAQGVSEMVAYTGIPATLTKSLMQFTQSKEVFLLLVNILLLIVGMFMETNTSILLFAPILVPVAKAFGVDPIHFSAIVLLNLEIGMITPPFAVNLFTASKVTGISVDRTLKPLLPFLAVCLLTLTLTTYFPQLSLWVVGLSH
jgi:C4-dicarboxylate transporter DctM subunit